jgi:hypothetical protein
VYGGFVSAISEQGVTNTKVNGMNNAALIMQSMIRAAWRLPERSPETGVAMHQELIVNACVFIEYPKVHIYTLETFYFI